MKKGDTYKCSICGKIEIFKGGRVGLKHPACYDSQCLRSANLRSMKDRYQAKAVLKKRAKQAAKAAKAHAPALIRLNDLILSHSARHPELRGRKVSYLQEATPSGFYLDNEFLGADEAESNTFIELNSDFQRWTTVSSKEFSFDEVAGLISIASERHMELKGKKLAFLDLPGRPGYYLEAEYLGKTLDQTYGFIESRYLTHLELWQY